MKYFLDRLKRLMRIWLDVPEAYTRLILQDKGKPSKVIRWFRPGRPPNQIFLPIVEAEIFNEESPPSIAQMAVYVWDGSDCAGYNDDVLFYWRVHEKAKGVVGK